MTIVNNAHQNFSRRLRNGRQHIDAFGREISTQAGPQTFSVAPAGVDEVRFISTHLLQHDQVAFLEIQERLTVVWNEQQVCNRFSTTIITITLLRTTVVTNMHKSLQKTVSVFYINSCPEQTYCLCSIDWLSCGYTSYLTQNRSFRRRSSQPISWLSNEKLKQAQQ